MTTRRAILTAHLTQFLNGNYTVGSPLGFADESPMENLQVFLNASTEARYNNAINILAAFKNKCQTVAYPSGTVYRIVATLVDGSVWYDSSKSNNNWASFKDRSINENHNTRIVLQKANLGAPGQYQFEGKYSTTDGQFESYVAVAVGSDGTTSFGCVRLSVVSLA
jgi:hypothetical protein